LAERILRALPAEERELWRFDPDRSALRRVEGDSEVNLHNLFLEYRASRRSARAGLVRKYADLATSMLSEIPALWIGAMKNVIPVVRSEFTDITLEIKSRELGKEFESLSLPLAGDLRIRLVYDFGSFVGHLRPENLATWGRTAEEVRQQAVANLARLEPPTWVDSGEGFHRLDSPDSYAESMFQLGSVVDALPFAADAVLLPCNRGILLAADGKSEASLDAMLREGFRCLHEEPWGISGTMIKRGPEGWDVATPPVSLAPLAHDLAVLNAGHDYHAQREALDSLHERIGRDVYTAEYSLIKRDDRLQSYCTWTKGVETLLPVADSVALMRDVESEDFLFASWQDVVEVAGARLQATPERPTRFLVTSFPDDHEWQALSNRASASQAG
jgi:hypothetical protein